MKLSIISILTLSLGLTISTQASAAKVYIVKEKPAKQRLKLKGDLIDAHYNAKAARLAAQGKYKAAAKADLKGDRIERRLDRQANKKTVVRVF